MLIRKLSYKLLMSLGTVLLLSMFFKVNCSADNNKLQIEAQNALSKLTATFDVSENGYYIYPDDYAGSWYSDGTLHILVTNKKSIQHYRNVLKEYTCVEYDVKLISLNNLEAIKSYIFLDCSEIKGVNGVYIDQKNNDIVILAEDLAKYSADIRKNVSKVFEKNKLINNSKAIELGNISFDDIFIIREGSKPSTENAGIGILDFDYTGWVATDMGILYYVKGIKVTNSTLIDGIMYRFSNNGICEGKYTGWTKNANGYRYRKNGIILKNKWLKNKRGEYYYINTSGYMVTGWYEVSRNGGKYSYFYENGVWDQNIYYDIQ